MKKKILYGFAGLAIAVVAAFNLNLNFKRNGLSDMALTNVEALANKKLNPSCISYCNFDVCCNCHMFIMGYYYDTCVYFRG